VAEAPRDRKTDFFSIFFLNTPDGFGILGAPRCEGFEVGIFRADEGKQFDPLENLFPLGNVGAEKGRVFGILGARAAAF
jgi:hypothetical protein